MPVRLPDDKRDPISATTKAAVEPVPRPRTMPLDTYSTALIAASFFRSSWVRAVEGTERALIGAKRGRRREENRGGDTWRRDERWRETEAIREVDWRWVVWVWVRDQRCEKESLRGRFVERRETNEVHML